MQKPDHLVKGIEGEDIAERLLRSKGYSIAARNWRYRKAEIDLICRIGNEVVFVEVKTRATDFFGYPEEAVSKAKQMRLAEAANAWIEKECFSGESRFDIIAIILEHNVQKVYHIEDAFYPGIG